MANVSSKKTKERAASLIVLVLCLLFYVGFALHDGPVLFSDSQSYLSMEISREMLYPLFLAACKAVFGEAAYLQGAVILQSILWALATWYLYLVAYRTVRSKGGRGRTGALCGLVFVLFQLSVSIMTRFLAGRRSMYCESILTESLAMPLFVVFCLELFLYYETRKKRHLVFTLVLCFLLVNIRSQMIVAPVLLFCVSFLYDLCNKRTRKPVRFFVTVLLTAGVLLLGGVLESSWNYSRFGLFTRHTQGNKASFCVLTYTVDEEDLALFDEYGTEEQKALMEEILTSCREQGVLLMSFREQNPAGSALALEDAFSEAYDVIGFEIAMPLINEYLSETGQLTGGAADQVLQDEVMGELTAVLIHQDKGDLIEVFLANVLVALTCAIAKDGSTLFVAAALLLYVLFLLLWVHALRRGRHTEVLAGIVTLGGILVNVVLVSMTIFPQARYMTYSWGLFYGLFFTLLYEAVRDRRRHIRT